MSTNYYILPSSKKVVGASGNTIEVGGKAFCTHLESGKQIYNFTKNVFEDITTENEWMLLDYGADVINPISKKTIKVGTQTFFKLIHDGIMVYNVDTKKLVVVEQHAKEAVPIEPETNIGEMCNSFGEIPKELTEPEVIDFSISCTGYDLYGDIIDGSGDKTVTSDNFLRLNHIGLMYENSLEKAYGKRYFHKNLKQHKDLLKVYDINFEESHCAIDRKKTLLGLFIQYSKKTGIGWPIFIHVAVAEGVADFGNLVAYIYK